MRLDKYMTEAAAQAAATTRLQEGLACVGFGMAQVVGRNLERDDMDKPELFLQGYTKFCDVDASDGELWNFIYDNETWIQSVITSVNAMRDSKWLKGKYTFYRGKSLMNQIYEQFNKLKAKDNINLANDKWNPGDIWASKISTLPNFDNLIELNKFISDSLKKGTLIGISLKKVGKSAKVVWEGPEDKPEIIKFKGTKKTVPFGTGIHVLTNKPKETFNVRSFQTSTKSLIRAELQIKGSKARHGKAALKEISKKYGIPQMGKSRISGSSENELVNWTVDLWRQNGYNVKSDEWHKKKDKPDDRNWIGYWMSRINSLEFGSFLNSKKKIADEILAELYIVAKSKTSISSEFIKIH